MDLERSLSLWHGLFYNWKSPWLCLGLLKTAAFFRQHLLSGGEKIKESTKKRSVQDLFNFQRKAFALGKGLFAFLRFFLPVVTAVILGNVLNQGRQSSRTKLLECALVLTTFLELWVLNIQCMFGDCKEFVSHLGKKIETAETFLGCAICKCKEQNTKIQLFLKSDTVI